MFSQQKRRFISAIDIGERAVLEVENANENGGEHIRRIVRFSDVIVRERNDMLKALRGRQCIPFITL